MGDQSMDLSSFFFSICTATYLLPWSHWAWMDRGHTALYPTHLPPTYTRTRTDVPFVFVCTYLAASRRAFFMRFCLHTFVAGIFFVLRFTMPLPDIQGRKALHSCYCRFCGYRRHSHTFRFVRLPRHTLPTGVLARPYAAWPRCTSDIF